MTREVDEIAKEIGYLALVIALAGSYVVSDGSLVVQYQKISP